MQTLVMLLPVLLSCSSSSSKGWWCHEGTGRCQPAAKELAPQGYAFQPAAWCSDYGCFDSEGQCVRFARIDRTASCARN